MFLINNFVTAVVSVFLIMAAIMAFFIPFWIFRIRNEVIDANKRLAALITLQKNQPVKQPAKQPAE